MPPEDSIKLGLDLSDFKAADEEAKRLENLKKVTDATAKSVDKLEEQAAEYAVEMGKVAKAELEEEAAVTRKARSLDSYYKLMQEQVLPTEKEAKESKKALTTSYVDLKRESDALEKELLQLANAFKSGNINLGAYQNASKDLVTTLRTKKQALADVETSNRRFGNSLLYSSYAVQDFTSQLGTRGLAGALSAVQNNIPQILSSAGASAAWAGGISVAAVAVGLLYENWDKFMSAMEPEKLKETADAMKKIADEAQRMKELKPPEQVEIAGDVTKLMQEQGNLQIWEGISSSLRAAGFGAPEDPQGRLAWVEKRIAEGKPVPSTFTNEYNAAKKEQEEKIKAEADRLLVQMPISKEARQTVTGMAFRKPKMFGAEGFAGSLAFYDDPKAMEEADRAEQEAIDWGARQHEGAAKFRRAYQQRLEQNKIAKALTEEGRHIEAQMWKEKEADDEREATKAKHEAKVAADKAAHAKTRAGTPAGQRKAEREAVEAEAERRNQAFQAQGGQAATPGFLEETTQKALQKVDAGWTIAAAVNYGIEQANQKMLKDFFQGITPMAGQMAGMNERVNGMNMHNPPGTSR